MNWLRLAWKNLGRNRRRTIATMLLVGMGVTGMMTTHGFALYTYESLREFAMRENGQLILSHPSFFTEDEEQPLALGLDNAEAIADSLLASGRFRFVLPSIEFNGLITNGEKSTVFIGKGVDANLPKVMGPALNIEDGRFLSLEPDAAADYEVIVGKGLAKSLKAELGTGLTLMSTTADGALNAVDVQVAGIVATGFPDLDARYLMVHNQTAQTLLDSPRVSQLSLHLRDDSQQTVIAAELEQKYPDLGVSPWQDHAVLYESVKSLYDRIFGVMSGVILIMVLFMVFNTCAMSVMERTREIGALGAMGTYPSEIVRLLLLEASYLAGLGTLVGVVISALVALALMIFPIQMPPPPGQTDGYPLQVYFSIQQALFCLVTIWLVGMVASTVAAKKGFRFTIAEALRYA